MPSQDKNTAGEQQSVDVQTTEKSIARKIIPPVINFVKKYKLIIAIVIVIIGVLTALFYAIPVINTGDTKLVNIDTSARLESDQTIELKGGNVSVKIKHFTNDTCPKGAECFWSGQAVEYMLTVDGKEYATGTMKRATGSNYQIETVSSDYKTYVIIKIVKSK